MKVIIGSAIFLLLLSAKLASTEKPQDFIDPGSCWVKPNCIATSYNNGEEWVNPPNEDSPSAEEEAAWNAEKKAYKDKYWDEEWFSSYEVSQAGSCCYDMAEEPPSIPLPSPIVTGGFQIYQESETYMLEIPPLTVNLGSNLWSAATALSALIPDIGAGISATMGVLGAFGVGSGPETTESTTINVTALFDKVAQQVETWDEEYDFGETLNNMRRKYTAMTEDFEQAISLEDALYSYSYYGDIDAELTSLLLDFEEDPSLYNHAYYTFQLLFLQASLHIQVKNMLALDVLLMNQTGASSDALQFLTHGQQLYETYGQLLLNYSTNVVDWRLKSIGNVTCSSHTDTAGEVDGFDLIVVDYYFEDFVTGRYPTLAYDYYPVNSCSYGGINRPVITGPPNADSLLKKARVNYSNEIQSGTTNYLNNYLLAFSQIGAQFPSVNQELVQQLACGMSCNPYA